MSGGRSKAKGTARSQASINHGAAKSREQRDDNIGQVRALAAKRAEEYYSLRPAQAIAREVKLRLQVANAKSREEEEREVQRLDLAFNFAPDGMELSDEEDRRRVREQEKVQHYWQARGSSRSGKWKSIPLGGKYDNQGQSSECPVWYLASNMTQWDTWAIIEGTRAGLNGKQFLRKVMTRHAEWFAAFTGHRLVVGQCHQKPHNIHAQHWFSVISEAIPDPGKTGARVNPQRPTGLLLGREDMKGRGKSPMRFAFLGKTGCTLANLRQAEYEINSLTGDPLMEKKLDEWIARRKRNGRPVLDLESEQKLVEIVSAVRAEHPEWELHFVAARKRHRELQSNIMGLIREEVAKRTDEFDSHDLRAKTEAEENATADPETPEGGMSHLSTPRQVEAHADLNVSKDPQPVLDARSRIAAMGDALRRTLAGIAPTPADLGFVCPATTSIGGFSLRPECWVELGEDLSAIELRDLAQAARELAAITEFTEFAAVIADLNRGDRSNPRFFDEGGRLDPIVENAAKAAANLGDRTRHPQYASIWAEWAKLAQRILDRIDGKQRGEERRLR